jgi:hypothetical protein
MARSFKEVAILREKPEERKVYEENYQQIFGKKSVAKITTSQAETILSLQEQYDTINADLADASYDDAKATADALEIIVNILRKYEVKSDS